MNYKTIIITLKLKNLKNENINEKKLIEHDNIINESEIKQNKEKIKIINNTENEEHTSIIFEPIDHNIRRSFVAKKLSSLKYIRINF